MVKRAPLIIFVALFIFLPFKVLAGSFMLSPVRVELTPQTKIK